ncbi:hypothetical protein CWC22_005920 [Pseudoalteromonas rubra]|uniref:Uncharacterized protein n=1 Tax=Pseudoalteromonas rubra TaxID=43658 RepID=A0A7S7YV51_9GAMM|nr:hypothetical protein CWC22_005920 [Pseudoalteromonas rubra]
MRRNLLYCRQSAPCHACTSSYHINLIPVQFEGAKITRAALKTSYLERLNSKILALLLTLFSRLTIEHLIKQIDISWRI